MLSLYRLLTRLLPRRFRDEFGAEMCAVVEEHWRAVRRGAGAWGRVRFWLRQGGAVVEACVSLRVGRDRPAEARRVLFDVRRIHEGGEATMSGIGRDLAYALRSLGKRPGSTAVTVLTLGLGIGAATTIFSAVHGVLLRPLPYADAERLVVIFHEDRETGERRAGISAANVASIRDGAARLEGAAVAEPWSLDLNLEGRTETLRTWTVSRGFFRLLGVAPILGRTFMEEEYEPGRDRAVLLGHRTWTTRFGADPAVVGTTIVFGGEPWTLVGVLPPAFGFPEQAEAWIPRAPAERDEAGRAAEHMVGVARLAGGASLSEAQAEADALGRALAEAHPRTNGPLGFRLVPLREHLVGDVRTPLLVLFGAVGFVLLIACANVAGLMLARGAQRKREYALRSALGASGRRLVRQITFESVTLAGAGALVGVGLAWLGVEVVRGLAPEHLPRLDELRVDGAVLAFAAGAAGLSALLSGLAPSLRLSRPDLRHVLADGGSGGGRRGHRLRDRLVVLEVGAAVVLLVGAGLLFRSFAMLVDRELGFQPENRLVVQAFAYDYGPGEQAVFVRGVLDELEAMPGVRRVTLASTVPGATDGKIAAIDIDLPVRVEGRPTPAAGQDAQAWVSQVAGSFFGVMGIPLVEGRTFDDRDGADAAPVVVVNQAFVRRHLSGGRALGERVAVPWGGWAPREVVGVVRDVRPLGFESEPRPEVYFPITQVGTGSLSFVLQTDVDPATLVRPATEAIWRVNPAQAVWGAAPLDALLGDWLRERRFNLVLLAAFAALALTLAAVGIYGLVSFSVEQRVAELGIRRALGGRAVSLLGMVLRQGAALAGAGVALGMPGALVLTRFLQGMLYGVEPTDPATFVVLGGAVMAVALLATLVPALRAVRVDPAAALKAE